MLRLREGCSRKERRKEPGGITNRVCWDRAARGQKLTKNGCLRRLETNRKGAPFSNEVPLWVIDVGYSDDDRSYDGQVVTRHGQREIGRATKGALRHDDA